MSAAQESPEQTENLEEAVNRPEHRDVAWLSHLGQPADECEVLVVQPTIFPCSDTCARSQGSTASPLERPWRSSCPLQMARLQQPSSESLSG